MTVDNYFTIETKDQSLYKIEYLIFYTYFILNK